MGTKKRQVYQRLGIRLDKTSNLGVRGSNPFRRAIEFFRILVLYERGQLYVFRCENVLFRRVGQSRDLRQ